MFSNLQSICIFIILDLQESNNMQVGIKEKTKTIYFKLEYKENKEKNNFAIHLIFFILFII